MDYEEAWAAFYRKVWPDLLACVRLDKDSEWQRAGVDRLIIRPHLIVTTIDEKMRERNYNDILLEEWSVCEFDSNTKTVTHGNKPGWAMDRSKRCDYLAYAIPAARKCYLIPFDLLRRTMWRYLKSWKQNADCVYPIAARNAGYTTVSIGVKWPMLKVALTNEMSHFFSAKREGEDQSAESTVDANGQMTYRHIA